MVKREMYMKRIRPFIGTDLIKVMTGIRRSGKSVMLELIKQELIDSGVSSSQFISINFEDMRYTHLQTAKALYDEISSRSAWIDGKIYLFFDEIQEVKDWEKCINSFRVALDCDIYITGSNAYMLSGDLATLLTGRYVEISMLPLSFKEYVEITGILKEQAFSEYMKTGGFPYIAVMDRTDEKVEIYLEGIYNTVIVRDIEDRQSRKEMNCGKRKITDITLLKTIARYLASVIGSPISIKSITNYLISSGRKVSANTVSDYVDALTESFIFYSVDRFDIVGKQLLKVNKKLYMVDLGLRNHILPRKRYDLGFSIENIVFFELLRRGNKVNIGKYGATEVDFVAQKQGVIVYYQVTADMTAEETFEREMRPLQEIKDNYEKIVLTLDQFSLGNYDGIKVINVIDWLLEN